MFKIWQKKFQVRVQNVVELPPQLEMKFCRLAKRSAGSDFCLQKDNCRGYELSKWEKEPNLCQKSECGGTPLCENDISLSTSGLTSNVGALAI